MREARHNARGGWELVVAGQGEEFHVKLTGTGGERVREVGEGVPGVVAVPWGTP
ncbi:hypothetical protein ACFO0F_11065 [Nonomuraea zeae]